MGGRGASSGISAKGNKYGSQYKSVLTKGNIKFLVPKEGNTEELLETMTRGRVYVLLNSKGNIKSITYFDNDNKRSRVVEIDHSHNKLKNHTHNGYERVKINGESQASRVTEKDKEMIDRVTKIWENFNK